MADIDSDSVEFEQILGECLRRFGVRELKPEQRTMIKCLLSKTNCVAILPTGYGKSLPYQIYLPLLRAMKEKKMEPESKLLDSDAKVVVCSPLIALMEDQVKRLERIPDLQAGFRGQSQETNDKMKAGKIDIFFSPEALEDPEWRSDIQKMNEGLIVVDEFHTISTWGGFEETSEDKVFRKWFHNIGELRSFHPNATVMALSATCTQKIQNRVMQVMNLDVKATTHISVSPNRSNIKLIVKRVANTVDESMHWILDALDNDLETFPRTIVYGNSIEDVSKIYSFIIHEMPHLRQYVDMFHSQTLDEIKTEIVSQVGQPDSTKKIVIATLAMGIDLVDFNSVILYGLPKNTVDILQQIGRVGRNGQPSVAMFFY